MPKHSKLEKNIRITVAMELLGGIPATEKDHQQIQYHRSECHQRIERKL